MTEARRQILDKVNNLIEKRKEELLNLLLDICEVNDNIKEHTLENFMKLQEVKKIYNY